MFYYLKFDSDAEAQSVLFKREEAWTNNVPDPNFPYKFVQLPKYDVVQYIGKMEDVDENGNLMVLDGWYANIYHTQPAPELEPYRTYPKTPKMIWI